MGRLATDDVWNSFGKTESQLFVSVMVIFKGEDGDRINLLLLVN